MSNALFFFHFIFYFVAGTVCKNGGGGGGGLPIMEYTGRLWPERVNSFSGWRNCYLGI